MVESTDLLLKDLRASDLFTLMVKVFVPGCQFTPSTFTDLSQLNSISDLSSRKSSGITRSSLGLFEHHLRIVRPPRSIICIS
ncbi:hypothetical protein JTE90_013106 [Oedothorax gibbosus]|uniref:Uncharacterized protein n=1 Tax=Oedothorax gibbosus TaxID=931172 RepID=A0AAV6TW98_9ARAC|nr:hypothetical protein JTE90_013106 [Oedothorax gibbosus]